MEYVLAMIWKEQMANAKLLRPLPGDLLTVHYNNTSFNVK